MNLTALIRNTVSKLFNRDRKQADFVEQQRNATTTAKQLQVEDQKHEEFKDANPFHHGNRKVRGGGSARCRCAPKKAHLIPVWCPRHRAYVLNGVPDRVPTRRNAHGKIFTK